MVKHINLSDRYKILEESDDFGEREVLVRRKSSWLVEWTQQAGSLHTVPAVHGLRFLTEDSWSENFTHNWPTKA